MRYLKSAFVNIPDQVVSTFFLWGFGYVFYRGAVSIFTVPPSLRTVMVVICIGMVLGLFVAKTQKNEKIVKNPESDK